MQKSETISKLAAALVKCQPQIEVARKDSTNPHFRSKYADLGSVWDACGAALKENNLAVSQLPDHMENGAPALTTMLIHESGEWIGATYPLISLKQDPQGYASATTYARRYGLASLLGILADDDDGEAASRPPKPSPAPINNARPQNPQEQIAAGANDPTADYSAQASPLTPVEWCLKGVKRVEGLDLNGLTDFTEKYHEKMSKIRLAAPKEHALLMTAIKKRYEVLQ